MECKSRKGWTFQQLLSVLIETLWNVNWISVLLSLNTGSINRNIVECKSLTPTHQYQPCSGINRNIVECKFNYWWSYYHSTFVLIETLWNVNAAAISAWSSINGINRNIVECKFYNNAYTVYLAQVLIETLWNVNVNITENLCWENWVLIETLWNVNTEGEAIRRASRMVLIETLWNVNRGQVIATPVENIVLIETLWNVNERANPPAMLGRIV